ncbi:MAG: glycosyltransferase family 39 protein [Candidatus Zambryskibacteria bacterium]|nr:glycosyltransferase family 39 protein [Candidatus Zambryskibacteria bacterium]
MSGVKTFFKEHEWILVVLLVLVFISIRLPGTDLPLHQDEYKWPMSVNPALNVSVFIPHPPIGELIYKTAGYIVGFNVHFRFVPLFFGAINLVLLYCLMKILFGRREAVVASVIWILSYFSVLASLMVDTDGQIMPFFFLLALIGYFKLKNHTGKNKWFWFSLMLIGLVAGILVKLSFALAIGAIVADFLWSKKGLFDRKTIIKYVGVGFISIIGFFVLILISKFIFPYFNLEKSLVYWEHFFTFDRGWFQTAIQVVKAVLYSSPFLILIPFLGFKEKLSKIRVFIFFIIFAFVFYIVLFDFSIGALDRYLQLLILPLTVMTAVIITPVIFTTEKRKREFVLLGIIVALILVVLQSLPHYVPPLHPKAEWISRILSLRWNFVYPFSGGSGPLGFYVSFLFMALAWIISLVALIFAKIKPQYKKLIIIFLIPIGLAYNGVFIEEYLIGFWNGSAPKLLVPAVEFIKNNPDIKKVIVYNDNGGNDIRATGKYDARLYIDPKFEVNIKDKIASFVLKEHFFVLNIPRFGSDTMYQRYFDTCQIIYNQTDKKISAIIYDCQNAPPLKP